MAVFDANVLAGLIVSLPWSDRARRAVAGQPMRIAPSLLPVEIGNAIWRNVRSGSLSKDNAALSLRRAVSIVSLIPVEQLADAALAIAIEHDHPIYDCFYLALAQRDNLTLITADRRLAKLAEQVGVEAELLAA